MRTDLDHQFGHGKVEEDLELYVAVRAFALGLLLGGKLSIELGRLPDKARRAVSRRERAGPACHTKHHSSLGYSVQMSQGPTHGKDGKGWNQKDGAAWREKKR